jgi:predicted molibdopterin-dependent oxidoreductase YjgC
VEIAEHLGGTKKSKKKEVAALASGLTAAPTGLLVLALDEAGGGFAADRLAAAIKLLRQLGEGWKFLPVFHARNAKGAYAAGAQGDRLPAGPLGEDAARNLMAELWGELKAKAEAGPTAIEILERAAAGEIRTLLLHRADELVHHPRRALIEKAIEATPNVIVVDVFPSWITKKASVVLPGALFFEAEGTMVAADGTIHALMPANLPPGEAQEDWRIIDTLCELLGAPSRYERASDVFADLARCWGAPPRTRLSDFWLEGPGFESPQRPQPAVIRKKTRPDFKLHFDAREGTEDAQPTAKVDAAKSDESLRLLFVTGVQGADHLTSRCEEFAELRPDRRIELNPKDMKRLKIGEGAVVRTRPGSHPLTVKANDSLPTGIAFAAWNVLGLEWDGGEPLPAIEIEAMEADA